MRKIDTIVIHCSDTIEGKNFTIDDIRRWHTAPKPKGNGWADIGYHYVIHLDGSIHKGRPDEVVGAHVYGHNEHSIGICYVGGKEAGTFRAKDTRTPEQKEALIRLLIDLVCRYPDAVIVGHRDLDPSRRCPCFDAKSEYESL